MYLVMCLKTNHLISINDTPQLLDLTWSDGMAGVCPVFKTKKQALKYAGKGFEIIKIDTQPLEEWAASKGNE